MEVMPWGGARRQDEGAASRLILSQGLIFMKEGALVLIVQVARAGQALEVHGVILQEEDL
jgi:hypothetical protein